MAQSPAERRRAQRQLAKELREQRAGRVIRERSAAGRAYRRTIERQNLPVFRQERQRLIGGGPSEGPRTPPSGGGGIDLGELRQRAFQNWDGIFGFGAPGGYSIGANRQRFRSNLGRITDPNQLERLAETEDGEWRDLAHFQTAEQAENAGIDPADIGWYDSQGNWHNIFWYK